MAAIHMRMIAYTATFIMHGYNLFVVNSSLQGPIMEDPNIRTFNALYKRFFTVWTMILQIVVASLGLTSDYFTLKYSNKKEPQWLSLMRSTKNRIFAAILWPTGFLCSSLFWSLYHYDRSLMYPLYADKLLSSTANHILHTAIVPIVVWELVFQKRTVPKTHTVNVTIMSVYMLTYMCIMYYTYIEVGVWLYPIFGKAYDVPFGFPLAMAAIGVAVFCYYYMQWHLTRLVWGGDKVKI